MFSRVIGDVRDVGCAGGWPDGKVVRIVD